MLINSVLVYLFACFFPHFMLQKFVNLTSLNFDSCQHLTLIPDVSCVPHLQKLSFKDCDNLYAIHPCRYKKTSLDHAHQHENFYMDIDDVAI